MSKEQKDRWIKEGIDKGYAWLIIVCDTFDYEDYPVYVKKDQDLEAVESQYNHKDMQRIMESIYIGPLDENGNIPME